MRRTWLLWLFVAAFAWLIYRRIGEVERLAESVRQTDPRWLLTALALQAIYFLAYAALYHSAFLSVGIESRLSGLVPVVFGSIFVNVVAPIGGAGGAALFVDDAARRGQSPARAAAGTLLALAGDLISFLVILVVGLAILFARHDLMGYEIAGSAILVLLVLGISGVLALGLVRPRLLEGLLDRFRGALARLAALIRRPPPLDEGWPSRTTAEYHEAGVAIRTYPGRLGRTLLVGVACHLAELAVLLTVFLALGQPISPGVLVAGYAVGVLFWFVSPTPQGIGVVEGAMALVFASLQVPGSAAVAAALIFRGLSFWLPLLLGFLVLQRLRAFRPERRQARGTGSVRAAAVFAIAVGLVNILSAVTPTLAGRIAMLEGVVPLTLRRASHLAAALAGIGLFMLAGGLWRRKRTAWILTELLLGVTIASHLLKGLGYEEAVLAAVLGIWLFVNRHQFHARADPPSIRQGLAILGVAVTATLFYGTAGYYLLDRHFHVRYSLTDAARQTVVMFTQFYDPGLEPLTPFGRFFADSIYLVAAVSLAYALGMLLRPVILRTPSSQEERERARHIVGQYGRSSMAHLTLMPDKAYFFTPGGSVIAYAAYGRGAVALGDPIGPPEDLEAAIRGFHHFCEANDWRPAFYQVLPDGLDLYRAAGFRNLLIGQEGIVDLAGFTTEGKAGKPFRTAANRVRKESHQFAVMLPPHAEPVMAELRAVSDEWLGLVRRREKRFSLGWFDDSYLRENPVATVRAPSGEVTAFANILPEFARNEISVDLMRHRRTIVPGTMEFLFLGLLEWGRDRGYVTFNLGMSALSGVGERAEDPLVERSLRFLYDHVEQFADLKGLHAFKAKFRPEWSPRYLIYAGLADLPIVVRSLVRAETGGGVVASFLGR